MSKHELEAMAHRWRLQAQSAQNNRNYRDEDTLNGCAAELEAALTSPSAETPMGEVTDAMVDAACAAGCKVDDPSFEWPGDYSPTEQATGRKCVRAGIEAALSVLPTPPVREGET